MPELHRSWIGGLRESGNASWPMCRLSMDNTGLTFEPSAAWLAWVLPTYRVRWSEIASIRPARGALLGSHGVRFELHGPVSALRRPRIPGLWPASARHPVFWCFGRDRDAILAAVPDRSLVESETDRVVL